MNLELGQTELLLLNQHQNRDCDLQDREQAHDSC
jgi:hypothetical protein